MKLIYNNPIPLEECLSVWCCPSLSRWYHESGLQPLLLLPLTSSDPNLVLLSCIPHLCSPSLHAASLSVATGHHVHLYLCILHCSRHYPQTCNIINVWDRDSPVSLDTFALTCPVLLQHPHLMCVTLRVLMLHLCSHTSLHVQHCALVSDLWSYFMFTSCIYLFFMCVIRFKTRP